MVGKRERDSIGLDWNARSEVLLTSGLFPLDQIEDKLWDVRTVDIWFQRRGGTAEQFSRGNRDLDDETADALEEQDHDGHLCENAGVFESPDLRFAEDADIFF